MNLCLPFTRLVQGSGSITDGTHQADGAPKGQGSDSQPERAGHLRHRMGWAGRERPQKVMLATCADFSQVVRRGQWLW